MASINVSKHTTLYAIGQTVNKLYLIVSGTVEIQCSCISYTLGKGDVIGLLESCGETHFCNCVTLEDCVLLPIPYSHKKGIVPITRDNRDMTNLFSISLFRQIMYVFEKYREMLAQNKRSLHFIKDTYAYYLDFCNSHSFAPQRLDALAELPELTFTRPIEPWEYSYYVGLQDLFGHQVADTMVSNPDVLNGFTLKAYFDIRRLVSCCNEISEMDLKLAELIVNEDKKDLLECFSSLVHHTPQDDPSYPAIHEYMLKMSQAVERLPRINRTLLAVRCQEHDEKVADLESGKVTGIAALHNSCETILQYSGCTSQLQETFNTALNAYKSLKDKNAVDDDARRIRKDLTAHFYKIYTNAFMQSLYGEKIPTVVKMFLEFGYMDEELAGEENAAYLYTLCKQLPTNPDSGIYSIYEWLTAIYKGQKAPSRNEFDQDYQTYLREQRAHGHLTAQEEAEALGNAEQRVLFELNNLFPSANKMTCGHIITFCPVFCKDQVIKPLRDCLVSAESIHKVLDNIRSIDFSAFYRDTIFTAPEAGVNREFVQIEILPDFILTPNIGTRAVMWQEIEGRKRTTPARMLLSVFSLEDLQTQITHLVGEFRWEMCRRIQGARWNDLSERSLTSEYFDYVQFYRKNHELSTDAKEKIKTSLQKARNSYKELFVQDYMTWILYESNGSPRLNKVARNIIFTYCPFSHAYREALRSNPLYTDMFDRYDIRLGGQIHKLENVFAKFTDKVPEELQQQMNYLHM